MSIVGMYINKISPNVVHDVTASIAYVKATQYFFPNSLGVSCIVYGAGKTTQYCLASFFKNHVPQLPKIIAQGISFGSGVFVSAWTLSKIMPIDLGPSIELALGIGIFSLQIGRVFRTCWQ